MGVRNEWELLLQIVFFVVVVELSWQITGILVLSHVSSVMKCHHSCLSLNRLFLLPFFFTHLGSDVFIITVVLLFSHSRLTSLSPSPDNNQCKQQHNNDFDSNTNKEDQTVYVCFVNCHQHLSWVTFPQSVPGLAEVESSVGCHRRERQHLSWAHLEHGAGAGNSAPVPGVVVCCRVSSTAAGQIHTAVHCQAARTAHLNRHIQRGIWLQNQKHQHRDHILHINAKHFEMDLRFGHLIRSFRPDRQRREMNKLKPRT